MNTCNIPLLSKDGVNYYFMNTPELDEALKKIPLWIHICGKLNL
jgi:hypothetical protein